jgi:hypothetical protein
MSQIGYTVGVVTSRFIENTERKGFSQGYQQWSQLEEGKGTARYVKKKKKKDALFEDEKRFLSTESHL